MNLQSQRAKVYHGKRQSEEKAENIHRKQRGQHWKWGKNTNSESPLPVACFFQQDGTSQRFYDPHQTVPSTQARCSDMSYFVRHFSF